MMLVLALVGCAQDIWNQEKIYCRDLDALAHVLTPDDEGGDDTPMKIVGSPANEEICEAKFMGLRGAEVRRSPGVVAGVDVESLELSYGIGSFPYFYSQWPVDREVDISLDDLVGTSVWIQGVGQSIEGAGRRDIGESFFSFGDPKPLDSVGNDLVQELDFFENVAVQCSQCVGEIYTNGSVYLNWSEVDDVNDIQFAIYFAEETVEAKIGLAVRGRVTALVSKFTLTLQSSGGPGPTVTIFTPQNTNWSCGDSVPNCPSGSGEPSWTLVTQGPMTVNFEEVSPDVL